MTPPKKQNTGDTDRVENDLLGSLEVARVKIKNNSEKKNLTSAQSISVELKRLRSKLQLTQSDFAIRYGIPLSNLQNWEQANKGIKPDSVARLMIKMIAEEPELVAGLVSSASKKSRAANG